MKCIVCDRCKEIIKNPRHIRVITCARPLKPQLENCGNGKTVYRGNDRQMNDIIWEKELCDNCMDELEAFFETTSEPVTPPEPVEPEPEKPGDGDNTGGDGDETGGGEGSGGNEGETEPNPDTGTEGSETP